MRQLLTETSVLIGLGTAGGVIVAWWGQRLLPAYIAPNGADSLPALTIDLPVLAFAVVLAAVVAIACGALPAWHVVGRRVGSTLVSRGSRNVRTAATRRLRESLVVVEVGLSVVALVIATLLLQAFWSLSRADLGVNADRLLTFSVTVAGSRGDTQAGRATFFQDLALRVSQLPGVERAGVAATLPIAGDDFSSTS